MNFSRPASVATFKTGKILGTESGSCATLNWLASCWDSLKGLAGISINKVSNGTPEISLNLEAGDGINIENTESGAKKITLKGLAEKLADIIEVRGAEDTNLESEVRAEEGKLIIEIAVHYKE